MKSQAKPGAKAGFTLMELVLVIGAITALSGAVMAASTPGKPISQARNSQRLLNATSLINGIWQNIVDHRGVFTCAAGVVPATSTRIASNGYNLALCLIPKYFQTLPYDPSLKEAHYNSVTNYDTGYEIVREGGKVTISAPGAELEEKISASR